MGPVVLACGGKVTNPIPFSRGACIAGTYRTAARTRAARITPAHTLASAPLFQAKRPLAAHHAVSRSARRMLTTGQRTVFTMHRVRGRLYRRDKRSVRNARRSAGQVERALPVVVEFLRLDASRKLRARGESEPGAAGHLCVRPARAEGAPRAGERVRAGRGGWGTRAARRAPRGRPAT